MPSSDGTHVFVEHCHPTCELQSRCGAAQQISAGAAALDQHHIKIWTAAGDHETRQTTSRTKVDKVASLHRDHRHKLLGVFYRLTQVSGATDGTPLLDRGQGRQKGFVFSHSPG